MNIQRRVNGFTLMEVMVVLGIISVLAGLALSSYRDVQLKARLKASAEAVSQKIAIAQSEAKMNRLNVYLSFNSGASWCFGLDDSAVCDCDTANSCQFDGVEDVTQAEELGDSTMTLSDLSTDSGTTYLEFQGARGTILEEGVITFTESGYSISVQVSPAGQTRICSDSIPGYGGCS